MYSLTACRQDSPEGPGTVKDRACNETSKAQRGIPVLAVLFQSTGGTSLHSCSRKLCRSSELRLWSPQLQLQAASRATVLCLPARHHPPCICAVHLRKLHENQPFWQPEPNWAPESAPCQGHYKAYTQCLDKVLKTEQSQQLTPPTTHSRCWPQQCTNPPS